MRRVSKTLAAALAAFLLAVGLGACGGGDSTGSTAAEAGGGQAEGGASGGTAKPGDAKGGDDGGPGSSGGGSGDSENQAREAERASFVPKQHDDSGGGSEQYRVKGGDNSVQEFGDEADAPERNDAAVALHNFLDARAEGNWAAACDYISQSMIESFDQLAARAKQIGTSCPEILERLTNPAAKAAMKAEAAQADVGSLRIEGERAFVVYTGIDGTILAMPMENEGGAWKVGSLAGTPLN